MPALDPGFRRDERDNELAAVVGASARKAAVKLTAEQWAEAEAAYLKGETAAQVAGRFGIARSTLYVRIGARGKRAILREEKRTAREAAEALNPARGEAPKTAQAHASAVEIAVIMARGLSDLGEKLIEASGVRERPLEREDGTIGERRHHSDEVWGQARRDYEEGDKTAGRIAERYGMTEATIRYRAWKEGWDKTVTEAPAPLLPFPDPAQIDEAGKSAWGAVAHEAQRAPERSANGGAWSTWLFQGGRGAGKTRAGAEWLAERAERTPNGLFALVGPTQHDVREVMIGGPSGLQNLPGRERPKFQTSRRRLEWKNGAVAFAFSAEEPERLRGPQFMAAWADEFCTWPKPEETLALLRMGLRLGEDPKLVVTTTPRPIAGLRKLRAEGSCVLTQAPTRTNAANLNAGFLSGLEAIYGGTQLASQELDGVLIEGDGALWKAEELARARLENNGGPGPEKFDKVLVGVDPPVSEGGVCGIVVAGRVGKRAYVLEDASVAGATPLGWARCAVEAGERHGAVRIVAEANQGGDMVRAMLVSAQAKIPVRLVHASRAKRARAEPVAALYEQGRVTHCGAFLQLEEELMAMGCGEGRLDRADALVWTLTALMLEAQKPRPRVLMM